MDLQEQLRSDPRVQALVQQQRNGALTTEQLRQLGYPVPDGFRFVFGGRAGYGTLMDDQRSLLEKAAPWISIGAGAVGGAGALGAVPGIGGIGGGATGAGVGGVTAGAAPSTATTAGAAGSTTGLAGSTATVIPGTGIPTVAGVGGTGVGAAPASGGILSTIGSQIKSDPLGTLGQVGDMLGKGASGAAQGRRDDSYAMANAGRVNLDALALDQKRATLRSLLGGLQDASISRPAGSTIPTFSVSGGLRPSALADKDALMAELSRPSPTVEMPKPGTGEKVMGGLGIGLGILGALGKMRRPSPATPPYNPNGGY